MARKRTTWLHRRARKVSPGAPPGHLVADPGAARPPVHVMAYGPDRFEERDVDPIADPDAVRRLLADRPVVWIDVGDVGHVETIRALGDLFGLHPLALEDVANLGQRAKVEPYAEHAFIVVRVPSESGGRMSEQVSLFLGERFVITFQERRPDPFDPVRERVRAGKGRIRTMGPDYLAYALIDAAVDGYFPIVERIGERLAEIEEQVIERPDEKSAAEIHALRGELLSMRRDIWPHREALNALLRDVEGFVGPETQVFLRDCYDHNSQLIDFVQTYREVCSDLLNIYMTSVSNRMNEVMKVLTIIATIFIPLSFVAGVYGMNFDPGVSRWNMPELGWALGYPFALGLMLFIALGLVLFFRRKRWF